MPVISLTQEMFDRGKTPERGWSPAILANVEERPAASMKSTNYFFEFELTGGPDNKTENNGRYITFMANSAGLKRGLGMEDFTRMVASLLDILPKEVQPDSYDTDKLKGKKCWIKVDVETVDGKLVARITDFSRDSDIPF